LGKGTLFHESGKKGQKVPFSYFIHPVHIFSQDKFESAVQRQGALRKLGSYISGLKTADYTTLWRRAATLDLSEIPLPSPDGSEVVSIDASGFKVTNRGDWMRHIWHSTRRGWIKVSIAVDVETKELLAIEVSDESRADNAYFKPLVDACTGPKQCLQTAHTAPGRTSGISSQRQRRPG